MKKSLNEKSVCVISLISDCFLAAIKLIIGKTANSAALFSDGLHSCADSSVSLVTLLGVLPENQTQKKRAEKITFNFICAVLVITGILTLFSSIKGIVSGKCEIMPSKEALYISAFAVLIKEALFLLLRYASGKTGSAVLYAQAWHHQSDALSSICGFVGIIGSEMGITAADKAASIFISILIIKSAFDMRAKN